MDRNARAPVWPPFGTRRIGTKAASGAGHRAASAAAVKRRVNGHRNTLAPFANRPRTGPSFVNTTVPASAGPGTSATTRIDDVPTAASTVGIADQDRAARTLVGGALAQNHIELGYSNREH